MVTDWLSARAQATPKKTALIMGERHWSYGELDRLVDGVCGRLLAAGVEPGQVVAILMPNSLPYVCLIHALARLGAVLLPLNTRLTTAELNWQLAHTGCRLGLYTGETADKCSMLSGEWFMVNDDWLAGSLLTKNHFPFSMNHLQAIIFTSGTSGRPKGVLLTFANHFWSATASAFHLGTLPDDRWLSCLPLYHVGGLAVLFRCCLYGTAVILHDGFDLDAINQSLDTRAPTLISLVPTMLHRLLPSRRHWPASLRLILLGGASAPPDLIHQANQLPRQPFTMNRFPLVAPTYGLTEAASQVATMLPEGARHKPGSVGRPLLFTTVRILGEDGQEMPPGEPGEIVVTGPTVMVGYYSGEARKERDDSASLPLSSLHTGDIGYLDADGDLWVLQRRSDLIVSGGENVYPAEVEAVLKAHPAVAAACVVGIPHPEWGQQVAAMVLATSEVSADELITFARQRLAGYKIPRYIQFAAALPQTASGKIHRQMIAATLAQSFTTSDS